MGPIILKFTWYDKEQIHLPFFHLVQHEWICFNCEDSVNGNSEIVNEHLGIKISSNKTLNVLYKLSISIGNTILRLEIITSFHLPLCKFFRYIIALTIDTKIISTSSNNLHLLSTVLSFIDILIQQMLQSGIYFN